MKPIESIQNEIKDLNLKTHIPHAIMNDLSTYMNEDMKVTYVEKSNSGTSIVIIILIWILVLIPLRVFFANFNYSLTREIVYLCLFVASIMLPTLWTKYIIICNSAIFVCDATNKEGSIVIFRNYEISTIKINKGSITITCGLLKYKVNRLYGLRRYKKHKLINAIDILLKK